MNQKVFHDFLHGAITVETLHLGNDSTGLGPALEQYKRWWNGPALFEQYKICNRPRGTENTMHYNIDEESSSTASGSSIGATQATQSPARQYAAGVSGEQQRKGSSHLEVPLLNDRV